MQIVYEQKDIKRILAERHSVNPDKVEYDHDGYGDYKVSLPDEEEDAKKNA